MTLFSGRHQQADASTQLIHPLWLEFLAKGLLGLASLIALVILMAWQSDWVAQLLPDFWIQMKANTATVVLLSALGIALSLRSQPRDAIWAFSLGALIVWIAGTALLGHITGQTFALDTWYVEDPKADMPGRMSIQTSVFFITMGLSLLLHHAPISSKLLNCQLVDGLTLILLTLSLLVIAGYLFDATGLFAQSRQTLTSPHTLLSFIFLTSAWLIYRTREGMFAILVSQEISKKILVIAIPVAILIPFTLNNIKVTLVEVGVLSEITGTALITAVTALVLWITAMLFAQKISAALSKLAQSEQQNSQILNAAAEGIIGLDANGRMTFINPMACQILHISQSDALGHSFEQLFHHHLPLADLVPPNTTPSAPSQITGQRTTLWRLDGESFPAMLSNSLILNHGQVTGSVIIFKDISESLKIEKMKEEFVSIVSHELRTPLTSIKGALGLLESPQFGELPPKAMQLLHIANKNADTLTHLINDLLDFSKIQTLEIQFAPIDLHNLIHEAMMTNEGYAEKFHTHLTFAPQTQANTLVAGDERRLTQVLTNLLSNAIKYSPEDGTVTVTTELRDNYVRVSVKDQGEGIPEAYQDKVFEKFTQADSSSTRSKGGTGLGLAITKEIVEKHHGRIGFETAANQGTSFYFELPLATPKPLP